MIRACAGRNLAPSPLTYHDVGGLYLTVAPTGAKWWRLKYRFGGKEKRVGFGAYPEVSLAEARERRDAARVLLRDGKDPGGGTARRAAPGRHSNS